MVAGSVVGGKTSSWGMGSEDDEDEEEEEDGEEEDDDDEEELSRRTGSKTAPTQGANLM